MEYLKIVRPGVSMTFEEYSKWWEYCRDKYDEKNDINAFGIDNGIRHRSDYFCR